MKFKEIKHLVSMYDNDVIVVWGNHAVLACYNFDYKNRELFYNAFLEDTTFDEYSVVSFGPHDDDFGYADGVIIDVEAPSNGL